MTVRHRIAWAAAALSGIAGLTVATLAVFAARTETEITGFRAAVARAGTAAPSAVPTAQQLAELPAPVQRYIAFTFRGTIPRLSHVDIEMTGQFRRPRTTTFTPTEATQMLAAATPALAFAATTPILPGVWARAYDAFVDGRMVMKAKILSAVAVVDEPASSALDRISLQRWLLESPLYPVALLPGGVVQWQAVDAQHARATASFGGMTASLLATFGDDGRLLRFDAETDGDLRTAYHGAGEHGGRDDYQLVAGMMLPMRFVIARAAQGQLHPFWDGRVTQIRVTAAAPPVQVAGR